MLGVDYSKKLDIQEETILLEMIPISTVTNIKTTTNDVKLFDKKKELMSKDDVKKDNKTVMKDSKFDNQNMSQKKIESKVVEDKKPDPKPEIKKEESKVDEKKIEQPRVKHDKKSTDDREKVPTKDIKKEPDLNQDKEKKDKKTEKKPEIKPKKAVVAKDDKKKEDKKKKLNSDDELANTVLKSLQEGGKKSTKNNKEKLKSLNDIMENAIKGDTTTDYDSEGDLSMSEIAAIRSQISQAWRVAAFSGGKDNKNMRIIVKIKADENGEVSDIQVKDRSMPIGVDKNVYNAFVDSVIRAIKAASPLQNLPEDKYNTWNEMELIFDSSGMIY